jgi:rhodanese-related sulfurtransferase
MPAFGSTLPESEIEDIVAWLGKLAGRGLTPPPTSALVPDDLPIVINPRGGTPKFTLREGRFVSAAQVKVALEKKQRIVIIDARTPSDWIQFRIPGSVPLPYYDAEKLEKIPNDGTWVVAYCACPHHASGEVVDALRKRNYPHTAVLDEGILFWKDHGYPLAGEAVAKKP